jgi:hypothetical protein
MKQRTQYKLTVSAFMRAADAGVKPVIESGYSIADNPALHKPSSFMFSGFPIKEDFIEVCKLTPWTSVWDNRFLPAVKACDWPVMDVGYKRCESPITEDGKLIGLVEIHKSYVWCN